MSAPAVWTAAMDARLRELWADGESVEAIADALGVSRVPVFRRVKDLRLPERVNSGSLERVRRGRSEARRCMCCGKRFRSEHIGNRLCGRCKTEDSASMADWAVLA